MDRIDHVQGVLEQWAAEAPGLDRAPMAVVGRISRLAQLIGDELEPVFARHGLNGGEFDVLASLRRAGAPYQLGPTQLCRATMVSSGGMTKRLAALEERGLVHRGPDPDDGRCTVVTLTDEGARLVDETLPAHLANEERMLAGLDEDAREELAGLLQALALSLGDEARLQPRRRRR